MSQIQGIFINWATFSTNTMMQGEKDFRKFIMNVKFVQTIRKSTRTNKRGIFKYSKTFIPKFMKYPSISNLGKETKFLEREGT